MTTSDGGTDQPATPDPRPRSGPRATYPVERSQSSRRRWFYLLSVVVVAAGLTIAYVGYRQFGDPEVSGQASGYKITSSSTIDVQFTVTRQDPGTAVACVVRARAKDGGEVGRREVLIPAGQSTQVGAGSRVVTSRPPVIGEVFGCTTTVPPYLSEPVS
ncbi:DUF4307 domain-containing protein [Gordonia sp. TBRC 11910]|uniref:DUF4307 domain-containing protein n=1 Tax=Gordonia asplenii TaxID=2725283 RepID=A0A848L3Z9_9ACTN|nr:DUF4307 domain-containing protein [Gordonia asplenii]NMO02358.1 DUF4307 domain-containing protein [Gordonia asplenii]